MTQNGFVGHVDKRSSQRLVGEVIESSTTEFLAQAVELDAAPSFGSFVEVAPEDGLTVYGVVAHVQTAGIDPGSRAIMRGHGDIRDERIYQENPDLPLVLRTTFRALVVGFSEARSVGLRFREARSTGEPRSIGSGEGRSVGANDSNEGRALDIGETRSVGFNEGPSTAFGEGGSVGSGEGQSGGFTDIRAGRSVDLSNGRSAGSSDGHSDRSSENRSDGFSENRSDGFGEKRSSGFGDNGSDGFSENRSNGFSENRSDGFGEKRSSGFGDNGSGGVGEARFVRQFLPPRPPRLHYSVFVCPPHTVRTFTADGLDYLQALLNAAEVPVDELLAANLRYTARACPNQADFLQAAGRELAQLLRADYARLTGILRRCLSPLEVPQ